MVLFNKVDVEETINPVKSTYRSKKTRFENQRCFVYILIKFTEIPEK